MSASTANSNVFYAFSGNNLPELTAKDTTKAVFDTKEEALDRCDAYLAAKIRQFYALRANAGVDLQGDNRWTYERNQVNKTLEVSLETRQGSRISVEIYEMKEPQSEADE